MLKVMALIFSLLLGLTAQAGDPIIPWPLDHKRQAIDGNDIEGLWAVTTHQSRVCIKITMAESYADLANILVQGQTQSLRGWLIQIDKSYSGKIRNQSDSRVLTASVFRARQKVFLRIQTQGSQYREYQLRRVSHCAPQGAN